ncbi:hypothetical protein QF035_005366 [Streptomyces umbrinus]|uniref:Uncharacterized protein n=1 Tax=Streptomyces umbrinus TaxID=67370 RepID=A0ABU0SW57_9ACTN|nr:hypothetical protein [Streptomyces umbrinus]
MPSGFQPVDRATNRAPDGQSLRQVDPPRDTSPALTQ